MFKRTYWTLPLFCILLALVRSPISVADEPVAGAIVFLSPDCTTCQPIESEILPALEEHYGERLEVRVFNAASPDDYAVLRRLEEQHSVHLRQVPSLFIRDVYLEGVDAIRERLPRLIRECLAEGGCPLPIDDRPSTAEDPLPLLPPPLRLEQETAVEPGTISYLGTTDQCVCQLAGLSGYTVYAAYFYSGAEWQSGAWSWFLLRDLLQGRHNLAVRTLDVDYPQNETLWHELCLRYGLSECAVPAVLIGDQAYVGEAIVRSALISDWEQYSREPRSAPWERLGKERPALRPTATRPRQVQKPTAPVQAQEDAAIVAHASFFHSPRCPHCQAVTEEVLGPLQAHYGSQFEVRAYDVEKIENYETLLDLEVRLGTRISELPAVFIGDAVLEGEKVIREALGAHVERCLASGECAPLTASRSPILEDDAQTVAFKERPLPGVAVYEGTGAEGADQWLVQMAYFYKTGCQECDRAWYDLRHLLAQVANLHLRAYDIETPENKVLNEALGQHYGVPERKRLTTPALFVGDRYLLGDDITLQAVQTTYQEAIVEGAPAPWDLVRGHAEQAREHILNRFRSFSPLPVIAAGFIDGLNPCAFATIVFFVSYLAISGRKGREILRVGIAFTLGVFLTYLLVGMGMWKLLQAMDFLALLGRWIYGLTAAVCLFLAVVSILDYRKARRGMLQEMTLTLPRHLRRHINTIVRWMNQARIYVGVAFATGSAISIIELACTGQVYLPTIVFVMGVPELRARALRYLILYNLMFITPLVVVFVLVSRGTTSQQLTRFLRLRTATVKLATSGLFLALAGWLLYTALGA